MYIHGAPYQPSVDGAGKPESTRPVVQYATGPPKIGVRYTESAMDFRQEDLITFGMRLRVNGSKNTPCHLLTEST